MIEIIGSIFLGWGLSELLLFWLVEDKMEKLEKQIALNEISNEYIKNRFKESLLWYEKYAYIYRYKFILYSMISIILSSSIPLITLWEMSAFGLKNKVLIGIMSTLISIISGYLFLREPKNKWYEYRKHAELLKKLYSIKVIEELGDNNFLEKLEIILETEGENWYSVLGRYKKDEEETEGE